jgi:ubiquinol-cytochrome c reductase cytochrome c1 subunit
MRIAIARLATILVLALPLGSGALAQEAQEEEETPHYPLLHPKHVDWDFSGPFGKYDPQQLQRGFQVYREVCSSCHSLELVAFRNLADEGGPLFSEEQAEAIAAEYEVTDGPNDSGDMFQRPGRPSDYFPSPFANEQAARASNGGAYPPDLSLIAKARAVSSGFPNFLFDLVTQYQEHGPNYIYSLLTGYQDPPANLPRDSRPGEGLYYNPYFANLNIAMPPPIVADGQVTYADGTNPTVDQMAKDVSAFLTWTAEPKLENRKRAGFAVLIFLFFATILAYLAYRNIWSELKARPVRATGPLDPENVAKSASASRKAGITE